MQFEGLQISIPAICPQTIGQMCDVNRMSTN